MHKARRLSQIVSHAVVGKNFLSFDRWCSDKGFSYLLVSTFAARKQRVLESERGKMRLFFVYQALVYICVHVSKRQNQSNKYFRVSNIEKSTDYIYLKVQSFIDSNS